MASFFLSDAITSIKKECEQLFPQMQALLALEKKLNMPVALPPMRGWAGSPDFLLAVSNFVTERQPLCVMECSSGVSTLVVARTLQQLGNGRVYSLEHDPKYAEETRSLLGKYGLTDWAVVLDAPLVVGDDGLKWYACDRILTDLPIIDMLIVDGPPEMSSELARYPALPRLIDRLDNKALIVLDDAGRDDEREIVKRWVCELTPSKHVYHDYEKGMSVIER